MNKYSLSQETLGYSTSPDPSNADKRLLVAGSKNVLVDYQKKVKSRPGYFRLGAENTNTTPNRNAWTWFTSTTIDLPQKFYDTSLSVYLGTIDGIVINEWTLVRTGWSATEKLRSCTWWDTTEKIDLQIMVNGDANIYEWNGAVAVVGSVPSGTEVTKSGTTTFAQNRFYTTRNKTFICVRTGTEYTYTGGETSTTLTGITDTTGLVVGDILVQKVVTQSNKPAASHTNHTIMQNENQIFIGSRDDEEVWISQNDDYDDFTFSAPRVSGEGGKLTLDDPNRALATLGKLPLIFSGRSSVYKVEYEQLTVGSNLAETIKVKKLDAGVNQGALNQESVVQIGDSLAYLSNEVALRIINNPEDLTGIDPRTFSNPIKPDFDAEDWTDAFGFWDKNILFYTAPVGGRMYMLNFVEDADGKLMRFWNPPQTLPVGAMSIIDSGSGFFLHGHSNATPESYLLFYGTSDGQYTDMEAEAKLPINAKAVFAYNNFGDRARLKTFDEYYVEGEITPNTQDLTLTLSYNFEGVTQEIERTIDGGDEGLLEGVLGFNSLAQQSLGTNPLGGLLNPPATARKFRVVFEIAKEDFHEIQDSYETNAVDEYWAIISRGSNTTLSPRRNTSIRR